MHLCLEPPDNNSTQADPLPSSNVTDTDKDYENFPPYTFVWGLVDWAFPSNNSLVEEKRDPRASVSQTPPPDFTTTTTTETFPEDGTFLETEYVTDAPVTWETELTDIQPRTEVSTPGKFNI